MSFPPQLRAWSNPPKNTTVSAAARAAAAVSNSSDPLEASRALAQGLATYETKTKALITGQAQVVSFESSVAASPSAGGGSGDLGCLVDTETGQLVGISQSGAVACSPTGTRVVVPTSKGGYISQLKLAYTYDGAFVGRLVFYLKANATAKPIAYNCGSAGGKAVDLLPNDEDYIITTLGIGCAPLPAINGGGSGRRRRRRALQAAEFGLSANAIRVAAAPLAVLPVDPATGAPQTPSGIGEILVPEGPQPVPTTVPSDDAAGAPGPPGECVWG